MILIPLGTSGWIPTDYRSTSSFLIEMENNLIIIDAGTGLYKLHKYANLLSKYKEVTIVLSHYHLDHIIGLSYIPRYLRDKKLSIWGPGKKYYKKSCEEILCDFTSSPYFADSIKNFAREVYLEDYDENGFTIGEIEVSINKQKHSDPSFGITIENDLHYATDTNILEESFTRNCKLILHECWAKAKKDAFEHSSMEEIKEMASKYNINRIGLIHINPRYTEKELKDFMDNRIFVVEEDKKIIL